MSWSFYQHPGALRRLWARPAVPSATGVADIFGFQNDGTVAAITSAGVTAWSANIPSTGTALPDFQGGLVVLNQGSGSNTIYKLDGITGQPYPAYTYSTNGIATSRFAVGTDGTVFAVSLSGQRAPDGGGSITGTVFGINPTTGAQTLNVTVPIGEAGGISSLIIAGDGYMYMPYYYRDPSCGPNCQTQVNHLALFRVNSAGANDTIDIKDWTSPAADFVGVYSLWMITNADTGVLLSVSDTQGYYFATTSGTSVSIASAQSFPGQAPITQGIIPVLQREDGSFVGTAQNVNNMVAFNSSGSMLWTVPNDTPQIATADGGVIGQSGTTYDQNGNATGQATVYTQSWTYNSYQIQGVAINQFFASPTLLATSWAFQPQKTAQKPLPDSVKANTDVVSGLGTFAPRREIVYYAFQVKNNWIADSSNPTVTITEFLIKVSGSWPPPQSACTAPGYNPNANETFCSFDVRSFDDIITYGFVRKQQIFVNLPGGRRFPVQIYPCTSQNTWGNPVKENLLSTPTQAAILVNGDAGSTTQRTCTQ